jgi:ribosomal protein S14
MSRNLVVVGALIGFAIGAALVLMTNWFAYACVVSTPLTYWWAHNYWWVRNDFRLPGYACRHDRANCRTFPGAGYCTTHQRRESNDSRMQEHCRQCGAPVKTMRDNELCRRCRSEEIERGKRPFVTTQPLGSSLRRRYPRESLREYNAYLLVEAEAIVRQANALHSSVKGRAVTPREWEQIDALDSMLKDINQTLAIAQHSEYMVRNIMGVQ